MSLERYSHSRLYNILKHCISLAAQREQHFKVSEGGGKMHYRLMDEREREEDEKTSREERQKGGILRTY